MPSTTTGSSGPRRQTRVSTPCSRRRSTRPTRPLIPVSRARLAAYSPPLSQARVREWQPSPTRQACRDPTLESTIDSTWRRGSPWAAELPRSLLPRTSTRSPRAPSKERFATAITHSVATPCATQGVVLFTVRRRRKSPTAEVAVELDLHSVGTAGFDASREAPVTGGAGQAERGRVAAVAQPTTPWTPGDP